MVQRRNSRSCKVQQNIMKQPSISNLGKITHNLSSECRGSEKKCYWCCNNSRSRPVCLTRLQETTMRFSAEDNLECANRNVGLSCHTSRSFRTTTFLFLVWNQSLCLFSPMFALVRCRSKSHSNSFIQILHLFRNSLPGACFPPSYNLDCQFLPSAPLSFFQLSFSRDAGKI